MNHSHVHRVELSIHYQILTKVFWFMWITQNYECAMIGRCARDLTWPGHASNTAVRIFCLYGKIYDSSIIYTNSVSHLENLLVSLCGGSREVSCLLIEQIIYDRGFGNWWKSTFGVRAMSVSFKPNSCDEKEVDDDDDDNSVTILENKRKFRY